MNARPAPMPRRRFLRGAAGAIGGAALGGTLLGCGDGNGRGGAPWPTPTTTPDQHAAVEELARRLTGDVLRPGDATYAAASAPSNGRFRAERPLAIARCADEADVVTCLQWSGETGIAPMGRGGGHSYAGLSQTTGLQVDLNRLNQVHVDPDQGIMRTGGAALNADLLAATVDGPVFLPGGTCLGVGVGGLTLGGGIGYNAHWAGLTADHLVSTRVVLADGSVVEASATEHPDLYWACRGGAGGNFGINIEFTFETVAVPDHEISFYRFDWTGADVAAGVLAAYDRMLVDAPAALNAVAMAEAQPVTWSGSRGAVAVMSRGQFIGPLDELRDLVAPLLAVAEPDSVELRSLSFWDAQRIFATPNPESHSYGDVSRYAREPLPSATIERIVDLVADCPHRSETANAGVWALGWIGGPVIDRFSPTDTAYVHRGMHNLWRPTPVWPDDAPASVGEDLVAWTSEVDRVLLEHTTTQSYQNFPNRNLDGYLEAYYAENLERLIDVKTAYDPTNVFRNPQSIPVRA